jgi:alpha-L-fucosidase
MRAIKAAEAKYVVFVAKHHDGFCLWPTRTTQHSVAKSPWRSGQGDVVREFVNACRAEGLKAGLYLSPWDRNNPLYGDASRYNDLYCDQLTELLTQYGAISEVWFDGANGEGPTGRRQTYDWPLFIATVRKLQPKAVIFSDAGPDIRWVGNERGEAPLTVWSTIDRHRYEPGTPLSDELGEGTRFGEDWVPAECDVSIRPGWFYRAAEDAQVKSPARLLELYEKSVGRNCTLLLNVPPDQRGQLAAQRGHAELAAVLVEECLLCGLRHEPPPEAGRSRLRVLPPPRSRRASQAPHCAGAGPPTRS